MVMFRVSVSDRYTDRQTKLVYEEGSIRIRDEELKYTSRQIVEWYIFSSIEDSVYIADGETTYTSRRIVNWYIFRSVRNIS